jgi:biopolymer transport protein ExbD
MNLRRRIVYEPMAFQLAPFIDVLMFLLVFFLLTWNIARYEQDIEVKVPTAKHATDPKRLPGEIIVNVRENGAIVLNRREIPPDELRDILTKIVKDFPDQAVILRADEDVSYRHVVKVLDACRAADLWNIAFATNRSDPKQP